jgi:glycosyltransferase involved in cell wall biosynthesis
MPIVSIVIPSFNCASYIENAIASCLNQTYHDREIIVVDDGSSDNTYGVVKPYESQGFVRYLYQSNKGLPGARNTGIREAKGDFIVVLDADDELDRRMISRCLERAEAENTDWCIINLLRIESTEGGTREEVYESSLPSEKVEMAILAEDFIRRAPFFRKKSLFDIGLYDEEMRIREDWDINIRMILAGKPFSYIPEPLYIYKIRSNSLIKSKYRKKYDFTLKLLRKHHKRLADEGDKEVARIYAAKLWRLGESYLTDVNAVGASVSCILESMKYDFSIKRLLHPFYFHIAKHFGLSSGWAGDR